MANTQPNWFQIFWRWINHLPGPAPVKPAKVPPSQTSKPAIPEKVPPSQEPKVEPIVPRRVARTYGERVKDAMLKRGYPWYTGPDAQNVVSHEGHDTDGKKNQNRKNAFDDNKMVLDGEGKIIGGPWAATTAPGVYWTEHPMAEGGAFIIALGPQSCWTPGYYHDKLVWRQAEDSHIYGTRDPNETYKRQGAPVLHGNIGVHHHGGGDQSRNNIGLRAAGCQVIEMEDDQEEFMYITLKNPKYLADRKGYRLMATVLGEDEVDEE